MNINRKLLILVILILVVINIESSVQPQVIAPSCFEKEDCKVPIEPGFCGVIYDCVEGRCEHKFTLCPETCYGGQDEDKDGKVDCDDPDCFDSPYCPCEKMSYVKCLVGRCYCPKNTVPRWHITEDNHWCACV